MKIIEQPAEWQPLSEHGALPIFLLRHGRTAANAQKRFVGAMDIPLDDRGHAQAHHLGLRMQDVERQGLYCSTLSRARETAEKIGTPNTIEGIHELNQGVFEGRAGDEVIAEYPEVFASWARAPETTRIPGGETLGECRDRAVASLLQVARQHTLGGPPILIVSHQMVIASLLLTALDLPLRFVRMVKQENTALNLLSWAPDRGLAVHRVNDYQHLPQDLRRVWG